jgi:hypothetical protein
MKAVLVRKPRDLERGWRHSLVRRRRREKEIKKSGPGKIQWSNYQHKNRGE